MTQRSLTKLAFVSLVLAGSTSALAAHAAAPAAPASGKSAIAVVNMSAVIGNSTAYRTAEQQRQTAFKPVVDQANARKAQIIAQLQPMVDKLKRDEAAHASQADLAQEQAAIEQIQQAGQQELQRMLEPAQLSEAYVQEQIGDKLGSATQAAMTRNGVSLLLKSDSVLQVTSQNYDLTPEVLAELNAELPSVSITPPAGWEPREVRDQRAAQEAQQGAARGTAAGGR
ncbi:MAG: OmpH family outer membrane protein [Sphingomonadales bacterium]|nr:OmpH family outer membrane protein [Sphingomonadales bacterium]